MAISPDYIFIEKIQNLLRCDNTEEALLELFEAGIYDALVLKSQLDIANRQKELGEITPEALILKCKAIDQAILNLIV